MVGPIIKSTSHYRSLSIDPSPMIDAVVGLPLEFNFLSNILSRIFHSQLGWLSLPKADFMNENALETRVGFSRSFRSPFSCRFDW